MNGVDAKFIVGAFATIAIVTIMISVIYITMESFFEESYRLSKSNESKQIVKSVKESWETAIATIIGVPSSIVIFIIIFIRALSGQ